MRPGLMLPPCRSMILTCSPQLANNYYWLIWSSMPKMSPSLAWIALPVSTDSPVQILQFVMTVNMYIQVRQSINSNKCHRGKEIILSNVSPQAYQGSQVRQVRQVRAHCPPVPQSPCLCWCEGLAGLLFPECLAMIGCAPSCLHLVELAILEVWVAPPTLLWILDGITLRFAYIIYLLSMGLCYIHFYLSQPIFSRSMLLMRLHLNKVVAIIAKIRKQQKMQSVHPHSSQFESEYHSTSMFISSLRKQSTKIEQMVAYIERLKGEAAVRDKLIQELRRREADTRMEGIGGLECARQEWEARMHLLNARYEEQRHMNCQLVMEKEQLAHRVKELETKTQLSGVKHVFSGQLERGEQDLESMKCQLGRWKEKYNNCKEECSILRVELERQQKNNRELEQLVKKTTTKYNLMLQQKELKINKMADELAENAKQRHRIQETNRKLEEYLSGLENQLAKQMTHYETQIRGMIKQIGKIEGNQIAWKQKYFQLEGIVQYIEGVRANWRLEKYCEGQVQTAKMNIIDEYDRVKSMDNSRITEHSSQDIDYLPLKRANLSSKANKLA